MPQMASTATEGTDGPQMDGRATDGTDGHRRHGRPRMDGPATNGRTATDGTNGHRWHERPQMARTATDGTNGHRWHGGHRWSQRRSTRGDSWNEKRRFHLPRHRSRVPGTRHSTCGTTARLEGAGPRAIDGCCIAADRQSFRPRARRFGGQERFAATSRIAISRDEAGGVTR